MQMFYTNKQPISMEFAEAIKANRKVIQELDLNQIYQIYSCFYYSNISLGNLYVNLFFA